MLPDFLRAGLHVVFCGTAAGPRSAEIGHYYAGRGNRFWETLYQVGMTPVVLAPEQDARVLDFGIGLTDVAKGVSGMDRDIPKSAYAPDAVKQIARNYAPKHLAFNGLNSARAVFGKSLRGYGQIDFAGFPPVWVLPSTSNAARWCFNISPWRDLAHASIRQ